MQYDPDNIPDKVVSNLKRVIEDSHFTPDQVQYPANPKNLLRLISLA